MWRLALILASCLASGHAAALLKTFSWDASPAAATLPGITYELVVNGQTVSGITGTTTQVDMPGIEGHLIDAKVRAIPPAGQPIACCPPPGCGNPPITPTVVCWTPSEWTTLRAVFPAGQTGLRVVKDESVEMRSPTKPIARCTGNVAGQTDITSASISVNAGDLLVLCVSAETSWTGPLKNITMQGSGGGTWTTDKDQDNGTDGGHASIHHLIAPSTTSFTIGVQFTEDAGPYRLSAQVYRFAAGDFDNASPAGVTGGGTGTTSPLNPALYTSTVDGSRAVYCATEYFSAGTLSSSDTYDAATYAGSISALSAYKASDTATAGTAVAGNLVGTGGPITGHGRPSR